MLKDATRLGRQVVLLNTVVVIQARLRAPANVQRGVHVRGGPVHDLAELTPVVHRFKVHDLHGGTGDDEAVVILVLDLVEGGVEGL